MCRGRRAAGRSVCVEAACQELFKWAAPAVDISLRPAGTSAHVSLPPSSPVNGRTGRRRPGFHQNTAHSLFWPVFAEFFTGAEVAHMSLPGVTRSGLDPEWWKAHRGQPVARWKSPPQPRQKHVRVPPKGARTFPVDQRASQVQLHVSVHGRLFAPAAVNDGV